MSLDSNVFPVVGDVCNEDNSVGLLLEERLPPGLEFVEADIVLLHELLNGQSWQLRPGCSVV